MGHYSPGIFLVVDCGTQSCASNIGSCLCIDSCQPSNSSQARRRLASQLSNWVRRGPNHAADLASIRFCFTFETLHGKRSGVSHLIPSSTSPALTWKTHALLTHLDTLKVFPAQVLVQTYFPLRVCQLTYVDIISRPTSFYDFQWNLVREWGRSP